jgi:hypothetical protein
VDSPCLTAAARFLVCDPSIRSMGGAQCSYGVAVGERGCLSGGMRTSPNPALQKINGCQSRVVHGMPRDRMLPAVCYYKIGYPCLYGWSLEGRSNNSALDARP